MSARSIANAMPATKPSLPWPVSPELVTQVEAAIVKQRSADALLPIHVIVPNHVLATLLERALFSDTGYIAVHVEMPHEFAWRIARASGARRRISADA